MLIVQFVEPCLVKSASKILIPTLVPSKSEIHLRRRPRCGSCLSLARKFCPLGFSSFVKMEPRLLDADGFSEKSCNNWKDRWKTIREKTNRTRQSKGWFFFLLCWRQRCNLRNEDWIQMCSNLSPHRLADTTREKATRNFWSTRWKNLVVVARLVNSNVSVECQ